MPVLSAFTPCGMLELSSDPSRAETIYNVLYSQLSKAYDLSIGTHAEAVVFAAAHILARARYTLERAGNQVDPHTAYDLIPLLEQDYMITPGPRDTVAVRGAAIAAHMLLTRGAVRENIVSGLRKLLGSDFIAYRPMTTAEAVSYPTTWTAAGTIKANPRSTTAAAKTVATLTPVVNPGATPRTVRYTNFGMTLPETTLVAGDVLMVQPANSGLAERVTVLSSTGSGTTRAITAVFANAHDAGAVMTTASWPYWWSTQRFSLIVLAAAAASDPEKRRKVNEFMGRVARGIATWAIVQPSGTNQAGPFLINTSPLGAVPLSLITYTPST